MSDNLLKLIARILLAVLFVVSGFGKLTDPSAVAGMLSSLKLPGATALTYLVGLGEVLPALAVSDDHPFRSGGLDHGCGNFARIGALASPVQVLCADLGSGTLRGIDGRGQIDGWWTNDDLAIAGVLNER